jgi:hypothetical protein
VVETFSLKAVLLKNNLIWAFTLRVPEICEQIIKRHISVFSKKCAVRGCALMQMSIMKNSAMEHGFQRNPRTIVARFLDLVR